MVCLVFRLITLGEPYLKRATWLKLLIDTNKVRMMDLFNPVFGTKSALCSKAGIKAQS